MISQKDLKILVLLLEAAEKEKRVSIEELAERLGLSVRTVRNNLERIDDYLKNNGFPILERDRKSGILLGIPREELEAAKKKLLQMNRETYVFSKEERILYLKMLLFEAEDYLTYAQLSETLFVSRKTVIDDVHQVKEDCEAWEYPGDRNEERAEKPGNGKRQEELPDRQPSWYVHPTGAVGDPAGHLPQ